MEKDKMIEEMANDIHQFFFANSCNLNYVAKHLIEDLNYRKIPDGSVVLSREEYEGKEITVEMSGGHKLRLTVGKFGEMSRVLEESTRKETAKEIFRAIDGIGRGNGWHTYTIAIVINKLKELAKQYGVEVEE